MDIVQINVKISLSKTAYGNKYSCVLGILLKCSFNFVPLHSALLVPYRVLGIVEHVRVNM